MNIDTPPKPPHNKGLRRLYYATCFSFAGLKACFQKEESFRIEVLASIIFIPLGLYLGETAVEKILLVGSILFILIVELINSAIERAVDRSS